MATGQQWSFYFTSDLPNILVPEGKFLSNFPAARIPQHITEAKKSIDFQLKIYNYQDVKGPENVSICGKPKLTLSNRGKSSTQG